MPQPITTKEMVPNARNSVVWNVLTQAVPRMPPMKTYVITTRPTMALPSQYGTRPALTAASVEPPPIMPMMM